MIDHSENPPKEGLNEIILATNFDFLIPISLQPNVVDFRYFKL